MSCPSQISCTTRQILLHKPLHKKVMSGNISQTCSAYVHESDGDHKLRTSSLRNFRKSRKKWYLYMKKEDGLEALVYQTTRCHNPVNLLSYRRKAACNNSTDISAHPAPPGPDVTHASRCLRGVTAFADVKQSHSLFKLSCSHIPCVFCATRLDAPLRVSLTLSVSAPNVNLVNTLTGVPSERLNVKF
jgi:hypothetical protein